MLLAVIGLSVIAESRINLRAASGDADAREAGILAFSAADYGLAQLEAQTINDDPTWRATLLSGQTQPGVVLGHGTMEWMLEDLDGDLNDDPNDPVILYGIGVVNEARRVYRVQLEPDGQALDCLASAVHSGGNLVVGNAGDVLRISGAPGTSNANFDNWGATEGDIECVGSSNGTGSSTGTITEGAAARQMPDPQGVFEFYVKNGTRIKVSDLPKTGGSGRPCIRRTVLSPGNNPYGADKNRHGIYVIDCGGLNVEVQDARIYGTLVLINAGAGCAITGSSHWSPAVPNYPVLMVDGGMGELTISDAPLDETTLSANFNPVGTPYKGIGDADTIDTYPSKMFGLMYVSGDLHAGTATIDGVLISGGLFETTQSAADTTTINYKATYYRNPPPGFRAGGRVVPVQGTWERAALP